MPALVSGDWKVFRSRRRSMGHWGEVPNSPSSRPTHKWQFWAHLVGLTELPSRDQMLVVFFGTLIAFSQDIKINNSIWRFSFLNDRFIFSTVNPSSSSDSAQLLMASKCRAVLPHLNPNYSTNVMLGWLMLDKFNNTVLFCRQDLFLLFSTVPGNEFTADTKFSRPSSGKVFFHQNHIQWAITLRIKPTLSFLALTLDLASFELNSWLF